LGLPGWEIKITTEVALKSGDMKPGIHIQISSPHAKGPWAEQSGGEEQRVRLAVAMGFSAVIQRMAGVWNRLEVWDEPSNWLSEQGVEDLLQCLAYRAETTNKTIWVIDHRSLSGNFAEVWSVIKDTNGSHIKVIAGEG
jgi:energy-coupling factor transporter ATP-binding protein EcfA2